MHLQIDRQARQPLYLQVAEQIRERIRSGALPAGSRLPPIRQLARELGLTRLTVHTAYAELQADGWIESFVGRGSFVAQRRGAQVHRQTAAPLSPEPRAAAGTLVEIMRLAHRPDVLSFAQAAAAPETFPVRAFGRALQAAIKRYERTLFDYGATEGEAALREQLAAFLTIRGLQVPPERILVTNGAQQGIDLVLRALVRPGDTVLVEQPTYLGMVERMQIQGLRLVGVPIDEQGLRPDALAEAITRHAPRLLYTIPAFHNPTGISMSPARQEAILRVAQQHGLLVLEDDIYGLLSYDAPAPLPLKARDSGGQVIYLSSFSKALMPGLRLGLVVADAPLFDELLSCKRLADLHAPQLTQLALAEYLGRGAFAPHLRAVCALYRERRDAMAKALQRSFPREASWFTPQGGLCFWVALPPGVDALELYRAALEQGVAFAPGQAFFPPLATQDHIRLSFAAHAPAVIERGLAILGELIGRHQARQGRQRPVCAGVPLV
ncbi:PLP-dependent aminotransferase family protein [Kallotenue papyrolyticum]|uniref:MocR-like pyridoxine biosynthesis transcription factor PdxR n=1 Tax=Kallotenue papyrolyticum TaxID=1325125 RepID=UPI0004923DD0|nr:PLP-dependent aminotransferase family protein [Kallotenue papyrolyticum]